jgi:hypothetical protein
MVHGFSEKLLFSSRRAGGSKLFLQFSGEFWKIFLSDGVILFWA